MEQKIRVEVDPRVDVKFFTSLEDVPWIEVRINVGSKFRNETY